MKVEDLVKLNLDDLEQELDNGSFSKSFLSSLLEAEKASKDRSGAIELIEDAIEIAPEPEPEAESQATSGKAYAVGEVSIGFKAGIKSKGDIVDLNWPEFKANPKLLRSLLDKGLVIKA